MISGYVRLRQLEARQNRTSRELLGVTYRLNNRCARKACSIELARKVEVIVMGEDQLLWDVAAIMQHH